MSKKEKHVIEVRTYAVVVSKVIVEASSKAEALRKAKNIENDQEGITDISQNRIEGLGDLVWKYEGIEPESVDAHGGIGTNYSRKVRGES